MAARFFLLEAIKLKRGHYHDPIAIHADGTVEVG